MTDEELTDLIAETLYDGNFVTAKESQLAAAAVLTALPKILTALRIAEQVMDMIWLVNALEDYSVETAVHRYASAHAIAEALKEPT